MTTRETDLIKVLEKSLEESHEEHLEEIGTVIKIGDGIAKVYGLQEAIFGELIEFDSGATGVVLDLDEDFVSVVLLDTKAIVVEQAVARRTKQMLTIPVGEELIGRIVDARGNPRDANGPITSTTFHPIERVSPGIAERSSVNRSLETGITIIDSLIPIGKGQRELVIGNRVTGKTTITFNTILHQKDKNVICVFVSIGQKQSTMAAMIYALEQAGAMDYTVVIDAGAQESALGQFLAPYTGCTIAEYFMHQGKDVLIIYDDLSSHAIAYRELSLLLKRPPGREAYPGDIFYIHSRLLERAGQLSAAYGGGSLTALPIVQTQGDDISSYIPTNLISITDGQVFLDTKLFNSGMRPAVNIGLSVSRVGGAAQSKAMKKVSGFLKLELAQYYELLAFAQFGSELDRSSQRVLNLGQRALELLKQDETVTYSFVDQVLFLFLFKESLLNSIALPDIKRFVTLYASYVKGTYSNTYHAIKTSGDLTPDDMRQLKKAAAEFMEIFA